MNSNGERSVQLLARTRSAEVPPPPLCLTSTRTHNSHLRQHGADRLMLNDRHPERLPFLGIPRRLGQRPLRQSHRSSANQRPGDIERLHRNLEPISLASQPILRGDPHVLERDRTGIGAALAHVEEF